MEETDLGDGAVKRPTYINAKVEPSLKKKVVEMLRKFKDCFAWDYSEMPRLSQNMVELKIPIQPGKKLVIQPPSRFAPEIM